MGRSQRNARTRQWPGCCRQLLGCGHISLAAVTQVGAVDGQQLAARHDRGQHRGVAAQHVQLAVVVRVPVRQARVLTDAVRHRPLCQTACGQVTAHRVIGRNGCGPQRGIALGVLDPVSALFCFALPGGQVEMMAQRRLLGRRLVPRLAGAPVTAEVLAVVAIHPPEAVGKQLGPARFARTKAAEAAGLQVLWCITQACLDSAKELVGGFEHDHVRRSLRNHREGAAHQTRSRRWLMAAAIVTPPPGRGAVPTQARPSGH